MAFALTPQLCGLSSQRLAQLGKLGLTGCSGLEERSLCPHWRGEQTGLRGAHSAEGSAQASQFCTPSAPWLRYCLQALSGLWWPPVPALVLVSSSQYSCHSRRTSSSLLCQLGPHQHESGE